MNYVDANMLIYATSDPTEKGEKARRLLDTEQLITNTLTLDEVAHILRKKSLQIALNGITIIYQTPNLQFTTFTPEDILTFKEFLTRGLKPRDAIHALTAVKMKCPVIYSEDPDFDKVAELKRKTPW